VWLSYAFVFFGTIAKPTLLKAYLTSQTFLRRVHYYPSRVLSHLQTTWQFSVHAHKKFLHHHTVVVDAMMQVGGMDHKRRSAFS